MSKSDVAAERKERIVRATVDCITKHGYHNFSMQDVAITAGVSKGIIHYYFLNKDELMMCVLDRVAGDIEKILNLGIDASTDPTEKLKVFCDVCFKVVRSTKEYYQVNMDFWTQINHNPGIRKAIADHYAKFRETAARVIKEGIERNAFRKVDPVQYASFVIAAIDGLSLQWLFDEKAFDYDKTGTLVFESIISGLKKS